MTPEQGVILANSMSKLLEHIVDTLKKIQIQLDTCPDDLSVALVRVYVSAFTSTVETSSTALKNFINNIEN